MQYWEYCDCSTIMKSNQSFAKKVDNYLKNNATPITSMLKNIFIWHTKNGLCFQCFFSSRINRFSMSVLCATLDLIKHVEKFL